MPDSNTRFRVLAYHPVLRILSALLLAFSTLVLLDLALGFLLDLIVPRGDYLRVPLWFLVRRFLYYILIPVAAVVILGLTARAKVLIDADRLVLEKGRVRWELPRASIAAVRAWWLAWPSAGVTLVLVSGRRFARRLALRDPSPLVAALGFPTDTAPLRDARARHAARWLRHPIVKHVVMPLVPTVILFRLHEIIISGGPFGELQIFGLRRWLYTLSGVYFDTLGHLILWAAALRVAVELVAFPAAWLPERWGRSVRLVMEGGAMLGYYAVPTWLLWQRLGA
jgi:hypothetical protein